MTTLVILCLIVKLFQGLDKLGARDMKNIKILVHH